MITVTLFTVIIGLKKLSSVINSEKAFYRALSFKLGFLKHFFDVTTESSF